MRSNVDNLIKFVCFCLFYSDLLSGGLVRLLVGGADPALPGHAVAGQQVRGQLPRNDLYLWLLALSLHSNIGRCCWQSVCNVMFVFMTFDNRCVMYE